MRLLMLATGPFAAPTFRDLFKTGHTVAGLVTTPQTASRGEQLAAVSAIREIAARHDIGIFTPEDINSPDTKERLAQYRADLMVVCDYGQILSADALATARLGGINLHASLLPKYRGAAPINWAIWKGETETGVTVIHITPKVDAGPCVAQATLQIGPDETAVELESRLSELGSGVVLKVLDAIASGPLESIPQDPALVSKAPRLKKTHGAIDWTRPASEIKNQIRALEPWPKTYTFWHRAKGPAARLILGPAQAIDAPGASLPGTVLEAGAGRLIVACGGGALMLSAVQPAGKRAMSVDEFLRGYRIQPGDTLGPEK
jgi:methionyl-tRNA formyltransferase